MSTSDSLTEFRTRWLPHATDSGLARLAELLERASPLLIHGAFTKAMPMGCLATHLGWHHPATESFDDDAGIFWLSRVAGLNPATSALIVRWDNEGVHDHALRHALLIACRDELDRRGRTVEAASQECAAVG